MAIGPDGNLYVTSGDRNFGERVQDPSNHFGKILRLNLDGSAPRRQPVRRPRRATSPRSGRSATATSSA